ncbi:hypothetical protein ACF07B_24570, partial [Streptomyces sp. NPDC015532]|uniref:hypothetical protein n=1 Tax=Streptomyces sp. NPDC015532 TaxID=3364960 RepID=UPI0036FA2A82
MAVRTADRWIAARIRHERWYAAAWALLGLALSAVAVGPGMVVPGQVATEAAFRDAVPCAGEAASRDDGFTGARDGGTSWRRPLRGPVLDPPLGKSGRP